MNLSFVQRLCQESLHSYIVSLSVNSMCCICWNATKCATVKDTELLEDTDFASSWAVWLHTPSVTCTVLVPELSLGPEDFVMSWWLLGYWLWVGRGWSICIIICVNCTNSRVVMAWRIVLLASYTFSLWGIWVSLSSFNTFLKAGNWPERWMEY